MRKLDFFWKTNKDWWYLDKNLDMRIKPDAPTRSTRKLQTIFRTDEEGYIIKKIFTLEIFYIKNQL